MSAGPKPLIKILYKLIFLQVRIQVVESLGVHDSFAKTSNQKNNNDKIINVSQY